MNNVKFKHRQEITNSVRGVKKEETNEVSRDEQEFSRQQGEEEVFKSKSLKYEGTWHVLETAAWGTNQAFAGKWQNKGQKGRR